MALRVPAPDGTKAADGLPVMVLPPGTELNAGYRLEFLAVGGMSVVYRAEGVRPGKPALLFAKEVASTESREVVSLVQEKAILERLRHPGIVRVHELFEEDGHYYMMTDFLEGESLDRAISPFPDVFLNERVVLGWGVQLAEIFAYLHQQDPPIIYRDLKPRNVMKDREGKLHLVDFGIARYHKEGKSKDTESLGTAATASPEHYTGQTNHRSDIFTLGATLHFLLSNGSRKRKAPFEFPPIRSLNPQVSERAEAVLQKCLEPAASQRYGSMEELRQALVACVPGLANRTGGSGGLAAAPGPRPVLEEPTEQLQRPVAPAAPSPRRSGTPLWVAGALLLGLGGGLVAGRGTGGTAPVAVATTTTGDERPLAVVDLTPSQPTPAAPQPSVAVPKATPTVARRTPAPRPTPAAVRPTPVAVRTTPPPYPVATPRPVAVAPPAYPVRRGTPEPAPVETANEAFFRMPWAFNPQAPRTAPSGEALPGGHMLVPEGFEQTRSSEHDLVFLSGRRRDIQVLRLRWLDDVAESPAELARRFLEVNGLQQGEFGSTEIMGVKAVTWTGEHIFHESAAFKVRTGAAFWKANGHVYQLTLTARPALFSQETFEKVLEGF